MSVIVRNRSSYTADYLAP